MTPKNKKRLGYLALFVILCGTECLIALFVHDRFIRPYVGDMLVIILLCALVRIAFPERPRLLGVYMLAVGVSAEVLQLFHLAEKLGAEDTWLGIALGSTCDPKDLLCYALGGVIFTLAEQILQRRYAATHP